MLLALGVAVYFDGRTDLHPLKTTKLLEGSGEKEMTDPTPEPTVEPAAEAPKTAPKAAPREETVPTAETHPGRVQLIVRISVPIRNHTPWKAMVAELEMHTRREPGCIHYAFGQIEGSATEFYVVEEYISVEALNTHSNSPYFRRLVPALGKISSTISVQKVFPLCPQPLKQDRSLQLGLVGLAAGVVGGVLVAKCLA